MKKRFRPRRIAMTSALTLNQRSWPAASVWRVWKLNAPARQVLNTQTHIWSPYGVNWPRVVLMFHA
jgi:hypothetical protein